MKLPDNEPLEAEDYWTVTDTWKQEWERGVQVETKNACAMWIWIEEIQAEEGWTHSAFILVIDQSGHGWMRENLLDELLDPASSSLKSLFSLTKPPQISSWASSCVILDSEP